MENNILISIIIPIYNVERYLRRCLDSVINQSYTNLEILLINDGSNDNSEAICKEYVNKDLRIKYYKKKNEGLAEARNFGLTKANGRYVSFIDSDDCVHKQFIEILYQTLKNDNADISICKFVTFSDNEIILSDEKESRKSQVCNSYESIKSILNIQKNNFITNHSWNKLYKIELFDEISFPKGRNFEDLGTTYLLLDKAKRISYIETELYFYYMRNDSITGSLSKKSIMDKIELVEIRNNYLIEKYENLKDELDKYMYINSIYMMKELIKLEGKNVKDDEIFGSLKKMMNELNNYYKFLTKKEKIIYYIIKLNSNFVFNRLKINKE